MRLKRKFRIRTSKLLVFMMCFSMLFGVTGNHMIVSAANNYEISNPRVDQYKSTWDKVTFGSYDQGVELLGAEPIKWRILDIDASGNAFLLADEALDCKSFNEKLTREIIKDDENTYPDYTCTWETSTLRAWLNGTGDYANDSTAFINTAFTAEERAAIITTDVVNNEYYQALAPVNYTTNDQVFLLSTAEATNTEYGFPAITNTNNIIEESKTRQVKGTDYARINGVYRCGRSDNLGNSYWWLRSPVGRVIDPTGASDYGDTTNLGYGHEYKDYCGVRPAMRVKLSALKDAGKVTSEGKVTPSTNRNASEYAKPTMDANGVATWDCVYFGNYKQRVKFTKKPIEWRVLSVNGDDAFLLADKALDCKPYNDKSKDDCSCTWETSTMRAWLNGTGDYANDSTAFINAAFSDDERKAIISTSVENADNPRDETEGGNDTVDKVYLLSIAEVSNAEYGFDAMFQKSSTTRIVKATDYTKIKGAAHGYYDPSMRCTWWLRSPGGAETHAAYMIDDGMGKYFGTQVWYDGFTVRPALHVNLSAVTLKTAGTVDSYGITTDSTYAEQLAKASADEVDALISAIGTVTNDSKSTIEAARKAYNELSAGAKARVTKLTELEAAEKALADLEKASNDTGDKQGDDHTVGSIGDNQDDTEETAKLPHTHKESGWQYDADGHWKICTECQEIIVARVAHVKDSGAVTKAATEAETGIMTYTCTECGYSWTEEIAKLTSQGTKTPSITEAPVSMNPSAAVTTGTTTIDDSGAAYTVTESESGKTEVEYISADTTAKKISVPSTVTLADATTATVTAIADNAFSGNKTVTAVTIPDTIEEIGDNAFKNCTKLKTVTIPQNVEEVGKNAFAGCASLTKVIVKGSSLTKVDQGAFKNCKKLKNVTLPKSVTSIGKEAFAGDKKLKTIKINGNKLEKVGKNAFKNVKKNATITILAKDKSTYNKVVKLIKKSGAKNVKYKFKKK